LRQINAARTLLLVLRMKLTLALALALVACAAPNADVEGHGRAHLHDSAQDDEEAVTTTTTTAAPVADEAFGGPPGSGSGRVVGYFAAWSIYDRNYQVMDIPADRLTHVNYGFANVTADGECVLGDAWGDTQKPFPGDDPNDKTSLKGSFHQLELLKQAHPKLKTLLSIGGWTWSGNFSAVAETAEGRTKLVTSCVAMMKQYGFDGLDLDWEFPVAGGLVPGRPEDKASFTALVAEFRRQIGTGLFTIAAPASPKVAANIEIEKVVPNLDWLNLMAYDFHGAWEKKTGLDSALFSRPGDDLSVNTAVKTYLAAKTPPDKIVVGVAAYGRGFSQVGATNHGLDQAFTGTPKGTWEQGVFDFQDLEQSYVPKMTRTWDPVAMVPTLYDATTQTFISYEDPESAGLKGKYVHDHGLGGAMIWELSGDDDKAAILDAVRAKL
jgi:chitinase